MKVSKSRLLAALAVAVALMPMLGSGAPTARASTSISFLVYQGQKLPYVEQMVAAFEKANPSITIDLQVVPDNQAVALLKAKAAARELPDVVTMSASAPLGSYPPHTFMTLDDQPWVSRMLNPDDMRARDGHIYGVRLSYSLGVGMFINKDVLAKYHIADPTDYQSLLAACARLKQAGIAAFYISGKDLWTSQIPMSIEAPLAVPGSTWKLLNTNKLKWANVPQFADILNKQAELIQKGYVNSDYLSATYEQANQAIALGKAAFYVSGDYALGEMQKYNPKVNTELVALPFGYGDVLSAGIVSLKDDPNRAPFVGYSIPTSTAHPAEAKAFLNFITQNTWVNASDRDTKGIPAFKIKHPTLTPFQKAVYDRYWLTHKTTAEMNNRLYIDTSVMWPLETNLWAGSWTAQQVLQAWDTQFDRLMKLQHAPGF